MKIIRIIILILVINLFPKIVCFSQDIYPKLTTDSLIVITPIQLKQTNLIFLEHNKFKLEISALNQKLSIQNQINKQLNKQNILNQEIINNYELKEIVYKNELIEKDKELKKAIMMDRLIIVGGFTVVTSVLILFSIF